MKVPAIALNMVDLPAPFEPTIVAKSPSFKSKFRCVRAAFSLTVPGLKVFEILKNYQDDIVLDGTIVFDETFFTVVLWASSVEVWPWR